MDTWGEDVAIFTPKSMHGAKMLPARGLIARIRRKGNAYGAILARWAQVRRNARKGCEVYGAARWVTPLGRATRQVAAPTGWAWRARWGEDATLVGAGQARRWRAWRCGDAALAGSAAIASWHVVAWARAWQRWRAERDAGGRALGRGAGGGAGAHGATGAMEAGDSWPRGVGAHSAQYANAGSGYSPKLASIAATRSSSAPMSCWFTSSIFCKSAGEAFST